MGQLPATLGQQLGRPLLSTGRVIRTPAMLLTPAMPQHKCLLMSLCITLPEYRKYQLIKTRVTLSWKGGIMPSCQRMGGICGAHRACSRHEP
ncbi:hypothetical protein XENTR_v10002448 [Xenopus tropicalis]|nr:hypothetical protein XENTR_v10002448 [Xenopus tropicalis]